MDCIPRQPKAKQDFKDYLLSHAPDAGHYGGIARLLDARLQKMHGIDCTPEVCTILLQMLNTTLPTGALEEIITIWRDHQGRLARQRAAKPVKQIYSFSLHPDAKAHLAAVARDRGMSMSSLIEATILEMELST